MRWRWPPDKRNPALADLRVVTRGHGLNHVVHACHSRRRDDLFLILIVEARNILGNGPGEEFNVLRQISDMPAEPFRSPMIEFRAINADFSDGRRPNADQDPRETGFSCCARTQNSKNLSWPQRKRYATQDRLFCDLAVRP